MEWKSRASSSYSDDNYKPTQPGSSDEFESRPTSRNTAFVPSYMSNYASKASLSLNDHQTKSSPVSARQASPRVVPPFEALDVFLVLVAGTIHPDILLHLEKLLMRKSFANIVLAVHDTQAQTVKQLKFDIYALLGRMGKEVVLTVHTRDEWTMSEIEIIVHECTNSVGSVLQGVLCCPDFDDQSSERVGIIELKTQDLARFWEQSVAFLHAAARATIPHLIPSCKPDASTNQTGFARSKHGPYFIVTSNPATYTAAFQIAKSACDTLMQQLENTTQPGGLAVGYAEAILDANSFCPKAKAHRGLSNQPEWNTTSRDEYAFAPSESPTRLWNMWALQNDLPVVVD